MTDITFPTGRTTSRLGFGCTVLKGGPGREANLRLLASAFDAGIRHYDVAPSYGLGVAESILADFLQERRDAVTVTTKVGLPRPKNPGALARARAAVRPLVAFAPALRRYLGKSVQRMSGSAGTRFDMEHVRFSVADSLRQLRTDHVDLLLLHEITPVEVSDELRRYLEDAVQQGMILRYGVGSYRDQAEAIVHVCPDLATIIQTSWTVGDTPLALAPHDPFVITHGAVRPLARLRDWLAADGARSSAIAEAVGHDLAEPETIGELMVAAAFANNPHGMVLVSSTQPARLARHATISGDADLVAAGARFNAAVTRGMAGQLPCA
jgi:hypothetical protein